MTDKSADITILGAGVFGLQLARQALKSGLSVRIFEARKLGAGASGGFLGALMPHLPDRWDEKKEYQLHSLLALQHECAELEDETGFSSGYRRIGRLMPLRAEHMLRVTEERKNGARENWEAIGHSFDLIKNDGNWLSAEAAAFGVAFDSLAARLYPPAYLNALAAYLKAHPKVDIIENRKVELAKCLEETGGPVVLATGYEAFSALIEIGTPDLGLGIKGQARLVQYETPADCPIIYEDGCYIVPHENGTVAIGSTSEKIWVSPSEPDPKKWGFFDKALELCPVLRQAPVIAQWAGVRPKSNERDPIIGRHPKYKNLWLFTGGFKISLGIAHHAAQSLLYEMNNGKADPSLPENFHVNHHFEKSARRQNSQNS